MQKIKIKVLNKMIEKKLTNAEINFIIYISHFQNDKGKIIGIYYKKICTELEISYQTFYDIKKSLVEKGIIFIEKKSYYDWDITILNNDFSSGNYQEERYINMSHNIFFDKKFFALKAGEKLLAMQFMQISFSGRGSYNIGIKNFYKKYEELLGITKRILQNYLSNLKKFFSIGVKDKQYWITPLVKIYKGMNGKNHKDIAEYEEQAGEVICRREKLDYSQKQLQDTTFLLRQYWDCFTGKEVDIIEVFLDAVKESLKKINRYVSKKSKWIRTLQPKLVHKLFKEIMNDRIA